MRQAYYSSDNHSHRDLQRQPVFTPIGVPVVLGLWGVLYEIPVI
jgi:hypothetical protein